MRVWVRPGNLGDDARQHHGLCGVECDTEGVMRERGIGEEQSGQCERDG